MFEFGDVRDAGAGWAMLLSERHVSCYAEIGWVVWSASLVGDLRYSHRQSLRACVRYRHTTVADAALAKSNAKTTFLADGGEREAGSTAACRSRGGPRP
eukprot:340197-Rhodomonas_salina.1